jgi:hypothetical protein
MTMIRYAITGHTSGVGRRAFDRLDAIGFSRSIGYDISDPEDRQRIIRESRDFDVFINCAHSGFASTYMLLDMYEAWQNIPGKTIINVGSRITEIHLPKDRRDLLTYQAEKLALKETVNRINLLSPVCKVKYRWFSYVGTERILKKYPHFKPGDYISEDQAVDIILS